MNRPSVTLVDETLRDGLQSPSLADPELEEKLELLHLMEAVGVGVANIGLPGAGARARASALRCAQEIATSRMKLLASCAARTTRGDIEAVAAVSQAAGMPVEVYAFIACSPIRLFVEAWTTDTLRERIEESVLVARANDLAICLVIEDATRASPDTLSGVLRSATDLGVNRFCLCDTVGQSTPAGAAALVRWTRDQLARLGSSAGLDWHGHNDRGLALVNTLIAGDAGCDRLHGTGLGVGERVGNTATDQLLLNLKLAGSWPRDLDALTRYCATVARLCQIEIPFNYPLAGRDAFRTATGVHAAAIAKALALGDEELADSVYSSVPARAFGRRQEIEIGQMSGSSNVELWLRMRNVPIDKTLVDAILRHAKTSPVVLSETEVWAIITGARRAPTLERAS